MSGFSRHRDFSPGPPQVNWPPAPEYIALFHNQPERAASVLRQLLLAGNERCNTLLSSFPHPPPPSLLPVLVQSDFPIALLELLSNGPWYESLLKIDAPKRDLCPQAGALIQALDNHSRFVDALLDVPEYSPSALRKICKSIPLALKQLWHYRDVVIRPKFGDGSGAMPYMIEDLLLDYVRIHKLLYQQREPSMDSYAGHLACHAWMYREYSERKYGLIGMANSLVRGVPQSQAISYARDIGTAIFASTSFADVIWHALARDPDLHSSALAGTLKMINLWLLARQQLGQCRYPGGNVLLALAKASQRHSCQGETGGYEGPADLQNGLEIVTAIGHLLDIEKEAVLGQITSNLQDLNFLSAISQCIVYSFQRRDTISMKAIKTILPNLSELLARMRISQPRNTRHEEVNRTALIHAVRAYWLPTLDDLREASRAAAPGIPRAFIAEALRMWTDLGREAHLNEQQERAHTSDDPYVDSFLLSDKLAGCLFVDCACYGHRPLHGQMKVCKRCWSAKYCGPRCQAKDWERGHKFTCRPTGSNAHRDLELPEHSQADLQDSLLSRPPRQSLA